MITVDTRTRFRGDVVALDPVVFVDEHAAGLLDANGAAAGRAAARNGLAPLTLDVEGELITLVPDERALRLTRRSDDAVVVALDRAGFSDLMQDTASTFGLQLTGRAQVKRGSIDHFVSWEPVLRCLIDGRPVHEGSLPLRDRDGSPLDVHRSFTVDDDRDEIGHFLSEAGFLHVTGVFTEAEMAAVSSELDDAGAAAERDDGASWWARIDTGDWYPSRILGFNQKSPALCELLHTERFRRLGAVTDDQYMQRDPDVGDTAEGLLKKVGVVEGISDVSWHKDCSMGGHSRTCCSLVVGISVTGATRESGELGVVPGSHRVNVAPLGVEGIELPRLALPTQTGDITVHCSCTLHMSRPPVSAERRVVYTGFDLAPRDGDQVVQISDEERRRERAALNDRVTDRQRRLETPAASYEL
jgi:hypothetical protein